MMNVFALGLVLSSLTAAGVLSPKTGKSIVGNGRYRATEGVVKEGHRLIVVEYERFGPQDQTQQRVEKPTAETEAAVVSSLHGAVEEATGKLKEATSVLPEVAERGKESTKEMVCDAYGTCKEKIGGLFRKSKDKASEVRDEAKEKVKETASEVGEKVREVKDRASEVRDEAEDKVKEKAAEMGEKVREVKEEAKETKDDLAEILWRGREVFVDVLSYVWVPETVRAIMTVVELLGFATAYGTCVWVTFVSSHVLAGALPKHQFGVVQSRLYPAYFRTMAFSVGVLLLARFLGTTFAGGWENAPAAEMVQVYNLIMVLLLLLVNMLFLEPKAAKVMFERMKMEKEEGRGRNMEDVLADQPTTPAATTTTRMSLATAEEDAVKKRMVELNTKLKNLNSSSSFLNILSLMGLSCHLVYLSRIIQRPPC